MFRLVIILPLLFFLLGSNNQISKAQSSGFTDYQPVPDYAEDTLPPYLIADQNRTVHAFTSQWVGDVNPQLAIVYRQWTLDKGWTPLVDILLSPYGQARIFGAFLDPNGMMHVVFFGGDDAGGDIYYSWSPAIYADQASAWSNPVLIARDAIAPSFGALAGDENGNLLVVYSGDREGVGLYFLFSSDYGETWSEPTPLYLDYTGELVPAWLHMSMGQSGQLYAVWNMVNDLGHNITAHFSKFDIGSRQWSEPIEFAKGVGIEHGMGIMNPAVIEYGSSIIIRFNNGIPPSGTPPAEWLQESQDGGQTWSNPLRIFPKQVGRNGIASFAVDSQDGLHLLFAERIQTRINGMFAEVGGIWYSQMIGNTWSDPLLVAENSDDFLAYDATAIISQGNVLLVTWRTDPGEGEKGVWYAYKVLDTPENLVIPLNNPTFSSPPTHQLTEISSSVPKVATRQPQFNTFEENQIRNVKPSKPIIISMLFVAFLVIPIFIIRYKSTSKYK